MRTLIILSSDLKNIFRDRSLSVILFVPFIFLAILRILPPLYESYLPVMTAYRTHILSAFCIISSGLMGFIMSFIFLEEKDQQLIPVFQVMPMPASYFLFCRTLTILLFGFIGNFFLIEFSNMIAVNTGKALLLSLAASFTGPSSTFLITALAKNKIEGVTYFKLFNSLLLMPIAGFFIASKFSLLFGIIPYYWIYSSIIGNSYIPQSVSLFLALFLNFIFMIAAFLFFLRKTYRV